MSLGAFSLPSTAQRRPAAPTPVTVEAPVFEGIWIRDAEPEDLQTLEYLSAFKRYPAPATPQQQVWLALAQQNVRTQTSANQAWRLYGLYHASRSGYADNDALAAALALNCTPEARIIRRSGRIGARLDPWFRLGRSLRVQPTVTLQAVDDAGKPLGEVRQAGMDRIEPQELSVDASAAAEGECYLHYRLSSPEGKVLAEVRRPVLLSNTLAGKVRALSDHARAALLREVKENPVQEIGSQTLGAAASAYDGALSSYQGSYGECMHPFVANLLEDTVPRVWSPSVRLESELRSLEELNAKLERPEPHGLEALTARQLRWNMGDGRLARFRVLLPDGFTASRRWPLVVAIHPEFGDASTLVEMYVGADGKTSILAEEARKRGYVVLLPGAERTFEWSNERSPAAISVLVRRFIETWPIDAQHVYLWGHSLGGSVALRLLQIHGLWAGVAVVGVGPARNYDYQAPANVPLAILAGTADHLISVQQALVLSYRLKPAVTTQEFIRLESQDHWSSGPAAIRPSFEFFDKVRQGKFATPAAPLQAVKPQA